MKKKFNIKQQNMNEKRKKFCTISITVLETSVFYQEHGQTKEKIKIQEIKIQSVV